MWGKGQENKIPSFSHIQIFPWVGSRKKNVKKKKKYI